MKKGSRFGVLLVITLFFTGMVSGAEGDILETYDLSSNVAAAQGNVQYANEIFIIDKNDDYVEVYDESLNHKRTAVDLKNANSDFSGNARAIERYDGNWYIGHDGNGYIYEFDDSWNYITRYASNCGINIDMEFYNGNVYVVGNGGEICYSPDDFSNFQSQDISSELTTARGIFWNGQYFYLLSTQSDIHRYDSSLSFVDQFTANSNIQGQGHMYGIENEFFAPELDGSNYYRVEADNQLNQPPTFNSSNVSPNQPLIGENVSYSAEVSDSDGAVQYVNLSLDYGGSTVVSEEQRTGSNVSWNDIFVPQSGDKWLNATLKAVDDDGAVEFKEINRFVSDNPPQVSLQKPGNTTYWMYNVPLEFSVSDSDDNPGEDWNCDVEKDGQLYTEVYLKEGVNSSYTGTVSSDLGSHSLNVSCTDDSGNTDSQTENYAVKDFEITSVSSPGTVFETEYTDYSIDYRTGDMVNDVESNLTLTWNGSETKTSSYTPVSGSTNTDILYDRPVLVPKNMSVYDWNLTIDYNLSKFAGGTEIKSKTSSTQSQTVEWGYYLSNQSTDRTEYVSGSDIEYTAYLKNKTSEFSLDKAEFLQSQDNQVTSLSRTRVDSETLKVSGSVGSDRINQSSLGIVGNPDYRVSFESRDRDLNASNITLVLNKLSLKECSKSSGPTALQFTTYKESDRNTKVQSRLDAAIEYWNPDSPSQKKVLNGSTTGKTHEYCIEPGYAEIQADSTEKLIQYSDEGDDYVLRSYFLINQTLNNQTTNIPLYMLNKTDSNRVRFTVEDENRNPVPDTIIKVSRYFPEVDKEVPVAMVKTGAEGQTETFLEVNEIYYSFNLYKDSVLRKQVPQQVIPSDLALKFTLGDELEDGYYDYEKQIGGSCDYNATQITCDYDSQTEALETVSLSVYEEQSIGKTLYDRKNLSTSTGTMTIDGFNASKTQLSYDLTAYFNNDVEIVLETGRIGDLNAPFQEAGLFLVMLQFLVMALAGLWKPTASIALGAFSLIISASLPFLAVPQTALTALIALAAVLIWRMN